jgi:hypothetical protein
VKPFVVAVDQTPRPEGVLVPAKVLDTLFAVNNPSVCANLIRTLDPTERGLLILTNAAGAAEVIELMRAVGSIRSLELAELFQAVVDR